MLFTRYAYSIFNIKHLIYKDLHVLNKMLYIVHITLHTSINICMIYGKCYITHDVLYVLHDI